MKNLLRSSLLAILLGAADSLRVPTICCRRSFALAAAAALAPSPSFATPPTFKAGKQRQGLGQFAKKFNTAVIAGDVEEVQKALKLFDMAVDEETAQIAIASSKLPVSSIESSNLPVIVEARSGLTSAKLTMRVKGASMTSDHFIKLLWLRDADTKNLITVRELTQLSETPEILGASVPKGRRVEPVAWDNRDGVFVGAAVTT